MRVAGVGEASSAVSPGVVSVASSDGRLRLGRDADLLVHDAQYTEDEYVQSKGWGHSTYGSAVRLAIQSNVRRIGLFHHDPDRDDESLERNLAACRAEIVQRRKAIFCFAAMEGGSISI